MEYTNHPGIGIWVVAIRFSVGKNHDIQMRNRQVDSILLAMHVIGSEIYTKNLMVIETIMLEEDLSKVDSGHVDAADASSPTSSLI